ncbi:MAG TPA: heme o synthase [Ktedonobacterales bacterium]|jgi:protoheme IX farnesyltransferase|nr:heme o synthase [Ktedonobacterales bacterium]
MQHVSSATTPAHVASDRAVASWRIVLSSYIGLMKPHVTVLLLGITLAAMALAGTGLPPVSVTIATLIGGALAAGSANAINCYWDRDIDRLMSRTKSRALPAGRITDLHALIFGIVIGALSFVVLAIFANVLAASLAVAAILFYVLVYTMWLKRSTVQNIVIGGAAGAVPVLVGWAAATGSLSWNAFWLFVIVFMWTPPHFWALSLVLKKDYARAGVPMLPVVKGEAETYRQIVLYTVLLVASSLSLFVIHMLGFIYLAAAVLIGGGLIVLAIRLMRIRTLKEARSVFWFSNYYLALLFAAMVVDHIFH